MPVASLVPPMAYGKMGGLHDLMALEASPTPQNEAVGRAGLKASWKTISFPHHGDRWSSNLPPPHSLPHFIDRNIERG